MANRKTNEQCMTWLRSMAADPDSLNGINAELCLSLIQNQKEQLERLWTRYQSMKKAMDQMIKKREDRAIRFMLDFPDSDKITTEQRNFLESNRIGIGEF